MLPDHLLLFMQWGSHGNPECLRLLAARDNASVVVREHHHRLSLQGRIEDTLAGAEEIIAINECYPAFTFTQSTHLA